MSNTNISTAVGSIPDQDRLVSTSEKDAAQFNIDWNTIQHEQPTINIGTLGHVAHGKSTIIKALTGISTGKYEKEKEKSMTIYLGYANIKIWKCTNPECPRPQCYKATKSEIKDGVTCDRLNCNAPMTLVQHASFVDCPGHEALSSTALTGAAVMDAALITTAATEPCPQPQASEHLAAAEVLGVNHFIIVQNKLDLVQRIRADQHREEIERFVRGSRAEKAPVIPISAQLGINMDILCDQLANIPKPTRDLTKPPLMVIIRSFDVNLPGMEDFTKLVGGVVGGTLLQGVLKVGQQVEIRPGLVVEEKQKDGTKKIKVRPLKTTITSISSEKTPLTSAVPGGLIGLGTNIDPSIAKRNGLSGQIVSAPESAPPIWAKIQARIVVVRGGKSLKTDESVRVQSGGAVVPATVISAKGGKALLRLSQPIAAETRARLAIARSDKGVWRLAAMAILEQGVEAEMLE
jgi:translation initiation factor 2 subunit 3